MTDMRECPRMLRNCSDIEARQLVNWKDAGIRDAVLANISSLWGHIIAQSVTDAFSWWIIILVRHLLLFFVIILRSMGQQLPRPGELQILFAVLVVCLGRARVQLGDNLLDLDPSYLQAKLQHDEFYHYHRLCPSCNRWWFHCMELVPSNDRSIYRRNVGSNS